MTGIKKWLDRASEVNENFFTLLFYIWAAAFIMLYVFYLSFFDVRMIRSRCNFYLLITQYLIEIQIEWKEIDIIQLVILTDTNRMWCMLNVSKRSGVINLSSVVNRTTFVQQLSMSKNTAVSFNGNTHWCLLVVGVDLAWALYTNIHYIHMYTIHIIYRRIGAGFVPDKGLIPYWNGQDL